MNADELSLSLGKSLPALFECTPAPREGVRVRTPLMYPDGGMVDVFVVEQSGCCYVTDFGETLGWLRMQSASARRSPKQTRMVEDTCQTLGVKLHRGQLMLRANVADGLGEAVLRLAQAAVRVSDLWFTFRTRAVRPRAGETLAGKVEDFDRQARFSRHAVQAVGTVASEVVDWLAEKEISFERDVTRPGRSGQNWTVDYQTYADNRTSLIFLLSTGSRRAARRMTEHVLAGCIDLNHLKGSRPHLAFISLFADTEDVWRKEDFSLVGQHSEVARWSRPDEFERLLMAA